jgi:hypothetical protein
MKDRQSGTALQSYLSVEMARNGRIRAGLIAALS